MVIGRIFTDTFAGIAPTSVLPFIGAQLVGAVLAWVFIGAVFPRTDIATIPTA